MLLQGLGTNLISLGLGQEAAFAAALLGDNAHMEKAWQDTGSCFTCTCMTWFMSTICYSSEPYFLHFLTSLKFVSGSWTINIEEPG